MRTNARSVSPLMGLGVALLSAALTIGGIAANVVLLELLAHAGPPAQQSAPDDGRPVNV
jgi:hypothetical protein